MKTITYKKYLKSRTDKQLIQEGKELDCMINKVECFGTKDIILFNKICEELTKRGYEPSKKSFARKIN